MAIAWIVPTLLQQSLDVIHNANGGIFDWEITRLSNELGLAIRADNIAVALQEFVASAPRALN